MRVFWTLLRRELVCALRERSLLIYSLVIPLLLYPLVLWLVVSAITFVEGQREAQTPRIEVFGASEPYEQLRQMLELGSELRSLATAPTLEQAQSRARRLAEADTDLIVIVRQRAGAAGRLEGTQFIVEHDSSRDRSVRALELFHEQLDDFRRDKLADWAADAGLSAAQLQDFVIVEHNHAARAEMGAFILGRLVPMTLLIMVALGATYPAVDTTAGERERQTWETTLTLGAPRWTIVAAKYVYVVIMAAVAGALNLVGMTLALRATILQLQAVDIEVAFPLSALPIAMVAIIAAASLAAAVMLIFASFAETYKQGQSLVGVVLIVFMMLPALVAQLPDDGLSLASAAIPVGGMCLCLRQLFSGSFDIQFFAVAMVANLGLLGLAGLVARRMLRVESLWAEKPQGSVRQRWAEVLGLGRRRSTRRSR